MIMNHYQSATDIAGRIRRFKRFQKRANALDSKVRSFNPGLFLFDEYRPKMIPSALNDDEALFWYLIVDLYCLFVDAGKYLFLYTSGDTQNGLPWKNETSRKLAFVFFQALEEVRSFFCHNKPDNSFLPNMVSNSDLVILSSTWPSELLEHLMDRQFETDVPFSILFDHFLSAANRVLHLIGNDLIPGLKDLVDNRDNDKIYEQWFRPIINHWEKNPFVYIRAWNADCIINNKPDPFKNVGRTIRCGLKNVLGNTSIKEYCKDMYDQCFSLDPSLGRQVELTPHNLFGPLLEKMLIQSP